MLFSHQVLSDSLRPHGLQHTRPPCPPPSPRVCPSSCPLPSVMPSNHLILCHSLPLLPSIFPSIRVFSNESAGRQHRHISTLFFLTFYFVLGYNRLTYNAVIISGEQQRNLAICIHVPILPQTPLPFRLSHNIEQSSIRDTVGP